MSQHISEKSMVDEEKSGRPESAIPAIPRPVTPKVRHRAWHEPAVRFWWLAMAVILVASLFMATTRLWDWWEESSLLRNGVVITAMAYDGNGSRIKNRPITADMEVFVEYEYQGKAYKQRGKLIVQGMPLLTGNPFEIHISPKNPDLWTDLQSVPALYSRLVGFYLLAIMAGVCGVMAYGKYRGFVWLWINGEAAPHLITEVHHVAGAPRSGQLHCTHGMQRHERTATVYVPLDRELPEVGQSLPLITYDHGSRALAVANYL